MTSLPARSARRFVSSLLLVAFLPVVATVAAPRATRVPFRFVENHIYLDVRVNGSRRLVFLLDSGATRSYLDERHVALLGTRESEASPGVVALRVGALEVPGQRLFPMPMAFGSFDGLTVDGMLGYDFIARFAVTIDYATRTVALTPPESYRPPRGGAILPLTLLEDDSGGKVPLVEVSVAQGGGGPVTARLIADTAVRTALTFNTPFVEAHGLLERTPKTIPARLPGGAMVKNPDMLLGRLAEARVGRFVLRGAVAAFSRERSGILAASEFDGVLGSEILRRFRVTFDYSRSRMILEPNADFGAKFEEDASGLSLVAREDGGRGLTVYGVVPGSPAAEAGTAAGDVVEAVDGRPASAATLPRVRALLRVPGRARRLTVRRSGSRRVVTIRLRALL